MQEVQRLLENSSVEVLAIAERENRRREEAEQQHQPSKETQRTLRY